MSINYNGERVHLFAGDYKPVEMYADVERNALKINQKFDFINTQIEAIGLKVNYVGNGGYRFDGTATTSNNISCVTSFNAYANHVYLINSFNPSVCVTNDFTWNTTKGKYLIRNTEDRLIACSFYVENGSKYDGIAYPQCIDLTEIYGQGNEPTLSKIDEALLKGHYPQSDEIWIPVNYETSEKRTFHEKVQGWVEESFSGKNIVIDETYNDVLGLTCNGKHEQKVLSGKNLYDSNLLLRNTRPNFYRFNDDGTITELSTGDGTGWQILLRDSESIPIKAGTYTVSSRLVSYEEGTRPVFEVKWGTSDGAIGGVSFSMTTSSMLSFSVNADCRLNLKVYDGNYKYINNFCTFTFPQLETGAVATEYEPYVGGIPSPSPDYPQDIVPTKPNLLIQSNLWNKTILPNNATISDDGWILKDADSYDNIFQLNACTKMGLKDDTDYTIFVETTGQSFVDYPDRLRFINDNRFYIEWVIDESGNKVVDYAKTLRLGKYCFKVHTKKEFGSSLGFGWFQSMKGLPQFKYRVVIVEGHHDLSEYSYYRTPQQLITEFELYGADGIYDTLEPCVDINGEQKCRVTRRWEYIDNVRSIGASGIYKGTKIETYNNTKGVNYFYTSKLPKRKALTRVYSPIANRKTNEGSLALDGFPYDNICGHSSPQYANNVYATVSYETLGIDYNSLPNTLDELDAIFKNWFNGLSTAPSILYQLAEPIIELYDPIPLYTFPYHTIINGNTDMIVTAKTTDYTTSELISMLNAEYESAERELE